MDNLEQSVTTEATEEKGVETNFTQEEAATVVPEEEAKDTSVSSSYVKEDEKEDQDDKDSNDSSDKEDDNDKDDDEQDDKKDAKKYALIEEELKSLKESYSALQIQYQELVQFKKKLIIRRRKNLLMNFICFLMKTKQMQFIIQKSILQKKLNQNFL